MCVFPMSLSEHLYDYRSRIACAISYKLKILLYKLTYTNFH